MSSTGILIFSGCVGGAGLALAVRELLPSQPKLGPALSRLSPPPPGAGSTVRAAGSEQVWANWLRRIPAPMPRNDLDLLGQSAEQFLLNKVLLAFVGLIFPALIGVAWTLVGLDVPLFIPGIAGLVVGAVLWFLPDWQVRRNAALARAECTHAIALYLELVALRLASNVAVEQALEEAARAGRGWVFLRLQETLLRARVEKSSRWQALEHLGIYLQVPVLSDVADFAQMSSQDGASIYESVLHRAKSVRDERLSDEATKANADSEKMHAPGAVLCILVMILLAFPAVLNMFTI